MKIIEIMNIDVLFGGGGIIILALTSEITFI